MAIHMDKYHRLVSGGLIPQLCWCRGGFYRKQFFGMEDVVYTSFTHTKEETGNVETVRAPALTTNYQTFERIVAPDYTQVVTPQEYIYQACWQFYRQKNATLLRWFAQRITSTEWCLISVRLLVKSKQGTDSGTWGEETEAVVTLGDHTYRLPAGGLDVTTIATQLATLIDANPSLNASGYENNITINLGARDRDFNISMSVTNPEANEGLVFNPMYSNVNELENLGRIYGYVTRRYRTTDGKDLTRAVLIGATRELEEKEALPVLDDDSEDAPDLIAVFVDSQQEPWVFYTTKLRPLLRAENLNDQVYSTYRLFGTVEATRVVLDIGFEAYRWETVYTPEPIQVIDRDAPEPPFFINPGGWPEDKRDSWVHEIATISDMLYGICGWIFRYQPISYYIKNNLVDEDGNFLFYKNPSVVDGTAINYRIHLEEGNLTLEKSTFPSMKSGYQEATINGLLLKGGNTSSVSIEMSPLPEEWEHPAAFWIYRDIYQLYTDGLSDNTQDPYLNSYWTITETTETFSYKLSKLHEGEPFWTPGPGEDENTIKEESIPNYKNELAYNGQTIYTGDVLHLPPERSPFISYQADQTKGMGYYTALLGVLNSPIPNIYPASSSRSDRYGFTGNHRQYTGVDAIRRVGDYPIGHGLMTVIDTNIPNSLCYVHYAYWFSPAQAIYFLAMERITEARTTPKELEINSGGPEQIEAVVGIGLNDYKQNIDDGVYYMLTPQHKALYEDILTAKQHATSFSTNITPLVAQHNQLYNQLMANPDKQKEKEQARQAVLDQLQQAFDDYLKLHYTVLVNNFASTQLIEELEPGEFFIAPNF